MDKDRAETVETTPATPGAREEDDTEESAREAAEALAADEVEAALAVGGATPIRTAKEIEGEKRVAIRIRQFSQQSARPSMASRESVNGPRLREGERSA